MDCLTKTWPFSRRITTLAPLIEPAENGRTTVSARDGFQNNVDYTKNLEGKLVNLVGEALAKMEPASLSYGIGRAHFALNRREPTATGIKLGKNPAGPTDESVPILRVQNPGGKPLAIVFGYACHNTTLRPDMMKIAADFAGYAQDQIETDNPGAMRRLSPAVRETPTPIRSAPWRWPRNTAKSWVRPSSWSWITRRG